MSMWSLESFRVYFCGYRSLSAKDQVECIDVCLFCIFAFQKHTVLVSSDLGKLHFSLLEVVFFWGQLCSVTVEISRLVVLCASQPKHVLAVRLSPWEQPLSFRGFSAPLEIACEPTALPAHSWGPARRVTSPWQRSTKHSQAAASRAPALGAIPAMTIREWKIFLLCLLHNALVLPQCQTARTCAEGGLTGEGSLPLAEMRETAFFSALQQ